MIISEKQLLILIQILRDSLQVHSSEYYFVTPFKYRKQLLEDILTQQNEILINIDDIEGKD